jgi:hypothetical protein
LTTSVRFPEIHPGRSKVTNHPVFSIRIREVFPSFSIFDQIAGHQGVSMLTLFMRDDTAIELIFLVAVVIDFRILSLTITRERPLNILVSVAN